MFQILEEKEFEKKENLNISKFIYLKKVTQLTGNNNNNNKHSGWLPAWFKDKRF